MKDIGFKGVEVFSTSQLVTLCIFIMVVFVVALVLRRHKTRLTSYLSAKKKPSRYSVEVQKVDSKASLYHIEDEENQYVVFKTPEGVVLLNKKLKDQVNDG